MALQQTRIDDTDGSPDAKVITFAFRGKAYEIDLSDKNTERLQKALQPFIDKARTPGSAGTARLRSVPTIEKRDYSSPEFAGLEHRGRTTETEAAWVRENLDKANANRAREGQAPINPNDAKMKARYGLK